MKKKRNQNLPGGLVLVLLTVLTALMFFAGSSEAG